MTKSKAHTARAPKFTGELAKPIVSASPKRPGQVVMEFFPEAKLRYEKERKAATRKHWGEMLRKLPLLAQHYGIEGSPLGDHGAAVVLLLAVCRDHIPGFQVAGRKGRPKGSAKRWDFFSQLRYVRDVEVMKKEKGCTTDRDAIWHLMAKAPYAPEGGRPRSKVGSQAQKEINSLSERLREARSTWKTSRENAAKYGVSEESFFNAFLDTFSSPEN